MGAVPEPLTEEQLRQLAGVLDLAREGSTADLQELLRAGVPANLTGPTGDTLLILAAYHDHPDTVAMLLDAGADPGRVNDRGQTALGAAVFRRSVPSVQALLGAGAGVHTGARSAHEVAVFFDLPDMLALLESGRP